MRYFNGFSLKGEDELFSDILIDNRYTISGFSHGAILAFEEAYNSESRVERLILISPAFFQNRSRRFVKLQIEAWEGDRELYISNFLKNCSYPSGVDLKRYFAMGRREELSYLLNYRWDESKLTKLKKRGVEIEVFIGKKDKIVDSKAVLDFFGEFATIYLFRRGGHILK